MNVLSKKIENIQQIIIINKSWSIFCVLLLSCRSVFGVVLQYLMSNYREINNYMCHNPGNNAFGNIINQGLSKNHYGEKKIGRNSKFFPKRCSHLHEMGVFLQEKQTCFQRDVIQNNNRHFAPDLCII